MLTRREALTRTVAASLTAALPFGKANAAARGRPQTISARFRNETILRSPSMNGDNWHMTWAADGRQYASLCDGYGDSDVPPGMHNSRLVAVEGDPGSIRFQDVPGYPLLIPPSGTARYYGFGVLATKGHVYQFLSTFERTRFAGVKLIYSPDNGRTWCNQDGSTPVVWEAKGTRSRETNMLFFEEPQDAFSIISVLQMGCGYEQNRDGYVYLYAPNGSTEGTMNELVMLRVPKGKISQRAAFEYFAGLDAKGRAKWVAGMDERAVVHTFPSGWVNRDVHPWAWVPSITYNAPLKLYMMTNWATKPGPAPERVWFQGPSYLGLWISPNPWGPWAQVHETTAWLPGNDAAARCYSPIIAPKWIAPDGKSFWLVWTDFQRKLEKDELGRRQKEIEQLDPRERAPAAARLDRLNRPYYSFNVQRVDLMMS